MKVSSKVQRRPQNIGDVRTMSIHQRKLELRNKANLASREKLWVLLVTQQDEYGYPCCLQHRGQPQMLCLETQDLVFTLPEFGFALV